MVIAAAQRRLPKSNAAVAGDNRPARRRSSEPNAATEAYSVGADVYCIVLNKCFLYYWVTDVQTNQIQILQHFKIALVGWSVTIIWHAR